MLAELNAAFQSCKALLEITKAANTVANHNELLTAVNDVQSKLADALSATLASQETQGNQLKRIHELEANLRLVMDWTNTENRYQLEKLPSGTFAYHLKERFRNDQEDHYICTTCVDNKVRTILQPKSNFLHCTRCKLDIAYNVIKPTPRKRRTISSGIVI